jgi:hypothetical protein
LRFGSPRLRAAALAAFLSIFVVSTGTVAPVPAAKAATATSPAATVIALARSKLGAPWVHYAVGPRAFDCSGLVYYVFRNAGLLSRIGGGRMSGYGYLTWARRHGLTSTSGAQPGDVVVWGGGGHVGIYIGGGKAISTLTSGVRIHGVYAVTKRFTTYIHTRLSGGVATPAAKPAAATTPAANTPVANTPAANAPDTSPKADGGPAKPATGKSRVTTTNLRLRTGAWDHVIAVLRKGTRVVVLGQSRDRMGRIWYRVQASGRQGWVASWFTRA